MYTSIAAYQFSVKFKYGDIEIAKVFSYTEHATFIVATKIIARFMSPNG